MLASARHRRATAWKFGFGSLALRCRPKDPNAALQRQLLLLFGLRSSEVPFPPCGRKGSAGLARWEGSKSTWDLQRCPAKLHTPNSELLHCTTKPYPPPRKSGNSEKSSLPTRFQEYPYSSAGEVYVSKPGQSRPSSSPIRT